MTIIEVSSFINQRFGVHTQQGLVVIDEDQLDSNEEKLCVSWRHCEQARSDTHSLGGAFSLS